jgi:hypothetical protein
LGQKIIGMCPDCGRSLIEYVTHACGAGSGPTPQEAAERQRRDVPVPAIKGAGRYCPEHPSYFVPDGEVCTLCREKERYSGIFVNGVDIQEAFGPPRVDNYDPRKHILLTEDNLKDMGVETLDFQPGRVREFVDKRLVEAILEEEAKVEDEIMNGNGRDGYVLETLHGVHLTGMKIGTPAEGAVWMDLEFVKAPEDDPLDPMIDLVFDDEDGGPDPVNPEHYRGGGMQAIDVIHAFDLNFNLGSVVKYVLRAGRKGPADVDLRKAIRYLEFELERQGYDR